jgi:hypothetical protein
MKWNEATRLLGECEQGLRKLVAEAAGEGDYPSVLRIADLAKAVAALVAERRPEQTPNTSSSSSGTSADTARRFEKANHVGSSGRKARSPIDSYPKFFRRGDELVKVGWSKKDRKEYNHRAPRFAIDAVVAAIRQVGGKGKLFNGDALLPLKNPTDGSDVPDYQGYVALAWLRQLGIVEQRGRRAGYTLASEKQIDSTITTAWPELVEWRG